MRYKKIYCMFLVVLLAVIVFHGVQVGAQTEWENSLNIYDSITTKSVDIRTVTNEETWIANVNVTFVDAENQNYIAHYKLSGNGTEYVLISEGVIVVPNNVFHSLKPNEKLSFNVEVKPAEGFESKTIKINVKINFRIIADANEDEDVNVFDLVIVGTLLGFSGGEEGWDIRADRNGDGKINVFDLVLVGKYLGWA